MVIVNDGVRVPSSSKLDHNLQLGALQPLQWLRCIFFFICHERQMHSQKRRCSTSLFAPIGYRKLGSRLPSRNGWAWPPRKMNGETERDRAIAQYYPLGLSGVARHAEIIISEGFVRVSTIRCNHYCSWLMAAIRKIAVAKPMRISHLERPQFAYRYRCRLRLTIRAIYHRAA